jgi:hypothetical protein
LKASQKPERKPTKTQPLPQQKSEQSSTLHSQVEATTNDDVTGSLKPEDLADLKRRYQEGEAPTDKSGRLGSVRGKYKTKAEREAEEKRVETFKGSLGALTKVASQLLCAVLPNPIPPTELEIQLLNDSLSVVAQKHFDKLLEYDAEASLFIIAIAIVIPRLKKEVKELPTVQLNLEEASALVEKLKAEEAKKAEEKKKTEEETNAKKSDT